MEKLNSIEVLRLSRFKQFLYKVLRFLIAIPMFIVSLGKKIWIGIKKLAISIVEIVKTICVTFVKGNRYYPTSGLASDIFSGCTALTDIYVYWASGQVANAPWGAPSGCKIHYTDGTVTV